MRLETKLNKLKEAKDLHAKHGIAVQVLDELLQRITGETVKYVETEKGTKASYSGLWYYRAHTIKVNVPVDEHSDTIGILPLAQMLDGVVDVSETILINGAPISKCIPVYCGDEPVFSFVFGRDEPKIFVPGIVDGLQGDYFYIHSFLKEYKKLLGIKELEN